MPSTFAYWKIRGLGQQVRLLLKYAEEDFEEIKYLAGAEVGEQNPAGYDHLLNWKEHKGDFGKIWFQEKFTLGLDFPNIPYYKDEKVNISQHATILRYLARKYDLEGRTDEDKTRLDLANDACLDAVFDFAFLGYDPKFHEIQNDFRTKKLPVTLRQFEDFLGDRPWIVGDYITWVDFILYENMDRYRCYWPNCFLDFPKLKGYLDRFEALPQIKAYMMSEDFIKEPFYGSWATYGGNPGECGPVE